MEVDLVKENHHDANSNEDISPKQLSSEENSEIWDMFGDREILPRVGEEYQVEVPPLLSKSDINSFQSSNGAKLHDVYLGLPVPVMWISKKIRLKKHRPKKPGEDSVEKSVKNELPKSESFKETKIVQEHNDTKPNIEAKEMTVSSRIKVGEVAELSLQKKIDSVLDKKDDTKGYYLVPGVLADSWSNIEEASFLLGLYIFGKNLVLVRKFVGSKQMGDILSFYYGKFFRSEKYRRWSECRKARGRKCIFGQRLFKGWRQHELVSRLLPHISEENKNMLTEVSKAYGDGKMSLEEYVFSIKAAVGLEAFVEAVGIGKGKQDLTGISMEPLKSNNAIFVRPEIPMGKACSALTPMEIVNYLTGDFRLSKARSSDLFWEAVWPRLLARGWHSEQPNNKCLAGTKHSLVFLVPGIKKYSRRKLVRGNHYFDSVSDVLGKVASDPELLELDSNDDKGNGKNGEENGWAEDSKLDHEDFPCQQRHCYLKPRTPTHNSDVMKFTVADTSLANGSTLNVRELRSLPVELLNISSSRCHSESDLNSSDESRSKSDSKENVHFDKDGADGADTSQAIKRRNNDQKVFSSGNHFPFAFDTSNQVFTVNELDSQVSKEVSTGARNAIVHRFSQKTRTDNKRPLANATKKRRKLNTFGSKTAVNASAAPKLKEEDTSCSKYCSETSENVLPRADSSHEKSSSSSGSNPITSFNQSRALIDLNLPIPPETDEPVTTDMRESQSDQPVAKPSDIPNSSEPQLHMNSRRLSSRNRPPTARALEARALGLLDVKQKRKSKYTFSEENLIVRPPRRARPKGISAENLGIDIDDFKVEDRVIRSCNGNSDEFSKLET